MILLTLGLIFGLYLLQLIIKQILILRKLPPGPWGFPLVGSMPQLLKNNTLGEFEKHRQKYGNVFSIGIGNFNCVVISGYKLVQEAFKREEFLGRPDFESWEIKNLGVKNRGILFCDGNSETWNEQRRFALRNLRDFGFGKESMEGLLHHELQELLNHLKTEVGKPYELLNLFNASVLNSLWYILTGERFALEDPTFKRIISLLTVNVKHAQLTGPGFFYPWPAKYNIVAKGRWAAFNKTRADIVSLIRKEIEKHVETHLPGSPRDFIDVYLNQAGQIDSGTSSFRGEEGKNNLIVTLHDLFVAGTETTSTTLQWALLHLSRNINIQEKLFDEIKSVVGLNRLPSRDDKIKMPYTEAVTNEVHRLASLLPLSVYHKTTKDTTLGGHSIPKDTVILANLYGVHHDKDYWKDPENFRPERFLDSSGTKLVKYEALMPFSSGRRQCLGETLARDTLFIFLVGIVQQFSFTLVKDSTDFDPKEFPTTCSFVLQPEPFKIILSNRA